MESQNQVKEYPFYVKATVVLLGLVAMFFILFELSSVLIPFAFAALFAVLLNPLFVWLDAKMNRILALCLTLLIAVVAVALLVYFLSTRIASFANDIPLIKAKLFHLVDQLQWWVRRQMGQEIAQNVNSLKKTITPTNPDLITNTVSTVIAMLGVLVLLPIYIFLLLYYKPLVLDFLFQVFSEKHSLRVAEILAQIKRAIQSFMVGLMIETAIVCTANSVALILIGVPNAIVIGIIGGILNILPYIGGIIAIALPVLMVLISGSPYSDILLIVAAYSLIQFVDNNFLVPRIVSSKVQINALISVLVVLLGGLLWGVSGMFLAIPFIAVTKIICDRIDELKPWGKLLGDEVPTEHVGVVWQKRWDRIFRRIEKEKIEAEKNDL